MNEPTRTRTSGASALTAMSSADIQGRNGGTVELSFEQRRMWFLDRFDSGGGAYNIARAVRLRGALDVPDLQAAHDTVASRHEILRTRYPDTDGIPVAVVDPPHPTAFEIVDLSTLDEGEVAGALERTIASESARSFDLSTGPVWRLTLVRLGPADHVLVTVIHHIAADGWSMPLLRAEIAEFYRATTSGTPAVINPLPVQYRDYAKRQLRLTEEGHFAAGLAYWRDKLSDDLPALDLPTDRKRPPVQTPHGSWLDSTVPGVSMQALEQRAREWQMTPLMLGLAMFIGFLRRYTGSDDITVGVPSAERAWEPSEPLIGLFVNTLPIRVAGDAGMSFRSLASSVRAEMLAALEHRSVPFEEIVNHTHPRRDPSRTPLFQALFQMRDPALRRGYGLVGIEEEPFKIHGEAAKVDITLELGGRGDQIGAGVNYNTDLFDATTIERMMGHFGRLASAAMADPDRPIDQLPMLATWERTWLLRDLNTTRRPYPAADTIPTAYRAAAEARPAAVAVVEGDASITYAELTSSAEAISALLEQAGLEPGEPVGIRMERSAGLVTAMLGVLFAGGVYVPLDPTHPPDRIDFLAHDAGLRIVLEHDIGDRSKITVTVSDRSAGVLPRHPHSPPAYVMYTSGSTGTPKGVVIPHRAVLRLVCNTDYVDLGREDVVAHVSNPAFDAATFEVWGALLNGARLLILDQDTVLGPSRLAEALARGGATTMFITTALFNLVAREQADAFASLKALLFGGEAADPDAVRSVLATRPPRRLVHVYGPTESTTFASWYEVETVPPDAVTVPIGGPVANTTLHVLGPGLEPVPTGVLGELFIGGDGLASGYLGDPTLTAARFIPDPFADDQHGRLFRTGDLVRRNNDGAIEFVRRVDRQLKLRGFRVEPEEIEAVIGSHPLVSGRVVRPVSAAGSAQLAAWVVPVQPDTLTADEILEYLQARLPAFMVPTFVQILPELPINPNGKIDGGRLRLPEQTGVFQEPRTETERSLAAIWRKTLDQTRVGRNDDFFELGGHSLKAVELLAAVEKAFGVALPLSTLFEAPTVARLAARLASPDTRTVESVVPIKPTGSRAPLFCFHPGGGNVFVYEPLARHLGLDRPVYGLQARGVDGREEPHKTIEEMASAYVEAIRIARPQGPYLLAGYSFGGLVAYEAARLLVEQGQRVAHLSLFDTPFPHGRFSWRGLAGTIPGPNRNGPPLTALVREAYGSARRVAGRVRYGPRWLWHRARNRPLSPWLAGKRLTHRGIRAQARYRPRPHTGTITFFEAIGSRGRHPPARDEWRNLAADIEVVRVPGTHAPPERWPAHRPRGPERRSILEEPHVATLGAELRTRLDAIPEPDNPEPTEQKQPSEKGTL